MLTAKQNELQNMVVYQVYPRSFKDSNGDGIGDLNGITEKLDYLKELGVNAVWLSPCYKSPNEDNGYDISDYRDIMDEFGTIDDWKNMISEMHKRGIKLIMDLVANHTSSEHKWFKESRKSKDNPYHDYYYWADEPLTDWGSVFGGPAWEYDEAANQYYLHSFAVGQPDLNWENPKVREEMVAVVDYWVNLGVDGFRCDVLDFISKDFKANKMANGPRFHEYVNLLFGRPEVEHVFTVGECGMSSPEDIKKLIGADRGELSTIFQFDHMLVGFGDGYKFNPVPFKMDEVRDQLVKWQTIYQENDVVATVVFENHDQSRSVSRFGNENEKRYESATMLATMIYLQKGIPFIYQGQEIGIVNPKAKSIDEFNDIESINYYNMNTGSLSSEELIANLNFGSRDNSRRPMPWNDGEYGGFGGDPWQPVYTRYKEINVKSDMESEKSVFKYYQRLLKLRAENKEFRTGVYENITGDREGMYIYKRYTDDACFVVVCNFDKENSLSTNLNGKIVLSNSDRREINGSYKPYECAVYKIK